MPDSGPVPELEANPTVFLIDSPSVRGPVRDRLRSAGIDTQAFGSAEEFLKAERPEAPGCLLLDTRMPGGAGPDILSELRRAGLRIPVVCITARGGLPDATRATEAGMVEFLAEPFPMDELLTLVERALARDHARREEQAQNAAPPSENETSARKEHDAAFDIALLNQMASRLSSADALHQALNEVMEFVITVVECDSCFIYLVENDDLVLRASKNPHPEVIGRLKMRVGQGITGWVAEHRSPVAMGRSAFQDPRFKLFNELPEDRFEAFLSVPLVSGGRLVGVINVQSRAPHEYTEREIGLVRAVGFLVGAEVERARLESENSDLSEKLETRKLVERAKGILQRELKISETEAYRILQRESQHRRKSMKDIAESVLLNEDLKRASGH